MKYNILLQILAAGAAMQACSTGTSSKSERTGTAAAASGSTKVDKKYAVGLVYGLSGPAKAVANSNGAITRLASPNGAYNLVMQPDGNFVEYHYLTPVWKSNTYKEGSGPYHAFMQNDGNLVVYQQGGQIGQANLAIWSSKTSGHGTAPYELTVQNDGNVVLFDATGAELWSTNIAPAAQDVPWLPMDSAVASAGKFSSLSSPNQAYTLVMQGDGNLVEYKGSQPLWSSVTQDKGPGPYSAVMQNDGNLVVYDATGTPTWASGTSGKGTPPYALSLTDYGNVKIYDANQTLIWSAIGTPGTVAVGSVWQPPQPSYIVNQKSGRCLNSTGTYNAEQATLWDCAPKDYNGVWVYSLSREIQVGADTTRCLTYETPSNRQAYADTQPCSGATNQAWTISAADGAYGQITPVQDRSVCLDASGGATGKSTPVIVYQCNSGAVNQAWSKRATGLGIFNANLPMWTDPSHGDSGTIAKQAAAWDQVKSDMIKAAAAGATSFTIPPGTYRARSELDINNVDSFTIYAAGVEIISEPGNSNIFGFYGDKSITVNGPIVLDVDSSVSAWVPATVVATDGQSWAQIKEWPGYQPLEHTPGQNSWFRLQFYDQLGTRIPQGIEYPVNPVGSSHGFTAQGGGLYTLPIYASQIAQHTLGIGTNVNVNVYANSVIGAQNVGSLVLNHGRIYGGVCCQFYAPNRMMFRDWKMMRRPGTNRLSGPQALFNIGTGLGATWIMDEGEVGPATDDLIDVHTGPLTADSKSPQSGLSSNQFYMSSTGGVASGWVLNFINPSTNVVYATATIAKSESTAHQNGNGGGELLITLDQNVTVIPGTLIDSVSYKMALGKVVDSYFHDGDNQGIQIKGSHSVAVTNNFVARVDSSSIFSSKDYESDFADDIVISNNTIDKSTYCPGSCLPWQAILADGNSQTSITTNNNLITDSPFGLSFGKSRQINQSGNQFTPSTTGALKGWLAQ